MRRLDDTEKMALLLGGAMLVFVGIPALAQRAVARTPKASKRTSAPPPREIGPPILS